MNTSIPLTGWTGIVVTILMLATWALRNFTTDLHWAHSKAWTLFAPLLSAILTAATQAVTQEGLDLAAIEAAVIGALGVALSQSRPVGKDRVGMLPWLLIGSLALSGCGFCKVQANQSTALCKTERIFTQCGAAAVEHLVVDLLPQVTVALLSQDWNGLVANLIDTLKSQGLAEGGTAVKCAISVIEQRSSTQLAKYEKLKASPDPLMVVLHGRAQLWLAAHSED